MIRIVAILSALAVVLGGCAAGQPEEDGVLIVATTSIVGDLATGVAGDEARVEVLIPVGADPHDFAPSARQAASLREADLVVASGLGLESGLADAIEAAAEEGTPILELGAALDPRTLGGSDSGAPDPHWWFDPLRAARAVDLIAERMEEIADGEWSARAATAGAELEALDEEIRSRLAPIPADRRKLVTSHDAFGYFAERYDFEVVGVLIPGGATQSAPDPQALSALATLIRDEGIPAIFAETTLPTNVAEALAAELGSQMKVVELFTGSLGEPGSAADTYAGMLLVNADRIVAALG